MIELDFCTSIIIILSLILTGTASYYTYNSYRKFTPGEIRTLSKWVLLSNVYLFCYLVTLLLVSLNKFAPSPDFFIEAVLKFIGLIFIIISSTCIIKSVLVIKHLAQEFGFNK